MIELHINEAVCLGSVSEIKYLGHTLKQDCGLHVDTCAKGSSHTLTSLAVPK